MNHHTERRKFSRYIESCVPSFRKYMYDTNVPYLLSAGCTRAPGGGGGGGEGSKHVTYCGNFPTTGSLRLLLSALRRLHLKIGCMECADRRGGGGGCCSTISRRYASLRQKRRFRHARSISVPRATFARV